MCLKHLNSQKIYRGHDLRVLSDSSGPAPDFVRLTRPSWVHTVVRACALEGCSSVLCWETAG